MALLFSRRDQSADHHRICNFGLWLSFRIKDLTSESTEMLSRSTLNVRSLPWVGIDKTHSEQNEYAFPPKAVVKADMWI